MTTTTSDATPASRSALAWTDCVLPDWTVAPRVRAIITTRAGGVSAGVFGLPPGAETPDTADRIASGGGLNLGLHTGDDVAAVLANRARLCALIQAQPAWLDQVHGSEVVSARHALRVLEAGGAPLAADASVTAEPGIACVVMVADCLPVLLADVQGRAVGAAHAGWRGLVGGVIERAARQVASLAGAHAQLHAYLGPAIGPRAFEVGGEVRQAFLAAAAADERAQTEAAFAPHATPGKYWADLPALARVRLARVGVSQVAGGDLCTVTDAQRFYSYRRDGRTGRFAGMIWLAP